MHYFIKLDDKPHGPLTVEPIQLRMLEGTYQRSDLVRREDEDTWVPLGSLKEFANPADALRPLPNPMAMASLVLGLVSAVLLPATIIFEAPWFWLTSILGLVLAHMALRKIGRNFRPVAGRRMAVAGLCLGYAISLFLPVIGMILPPFTKIAERSPMTRAISNCKQAIIYLRNYASDHDGKYPDAALHGATTSNEVFRELFRDGVADNETVFGCLESQIGKPDGNIGTAPDYIEAVKPGENHWAMTKGGSDSAGVFPLIFENTLDASWPPKWNPSLSKTDKPGRTWSGGKVVIGMNDGSVAIQKTDSATSTSSSLAPNPHGTTIFPASASKLSILNAAR